VAIGIAEVEGSAGIQPITIGSLVSTPKNESGKIPYAVIIHFLSGPFSIFYLCIKKSDNLLFSINIIKGSVSGVKNLAKAILVSNRYSDDFLMHHFCYSCIVDKIR
jgi:hypothetical protein